MTLQPDLLDLLHPLSAKRAVFLMCVQTAVLADCNIGPARAARIIVEAGVIPDDLILSDWFQLSAMLDEFICWALDTGPWPDWYKSEWSREQ